MSSGGSGHADDEASTPWERPRRWASERPDSPSVDDLLARLATPDQAIGSRRHRRAADTAADAVPAGDLIAAFSENPDPEPAPDRPASTAPASVETPTPTAPAAPDDAIAAADETVVLPAVTILPTDAESQPSASWESVLASLHRQAGAPAEHPGLAPSATHGTPAGFSRRPSSHADHPHHRWLLAGRSVVALVTVLLLVAAGWDWVSKVRAQNVLTDNNVSAVVTNDTNISTPTARPTSGQAPGVPVADAPAKTYHAENILLMGSDTRSTAEDAKLGGAGTTTMQSDVMMIAHLSADRSHVTVVSIPRDLYVKAPTCKAWDYQTNTLSNKDYPNTFSEWKITNAYSVGGPQCTVRAVQKLTGLRIDRVIIIDFSGFKTMVNALGGITIKACRPIIDGNLGTVIAHPGTQHINGTQALKLVRAREVRGDSESDLARIHRQQMVLSILLRQATSAGVLLNPARLNSLLQAFVHSVHTDNVTLDDLLTIAQSLGNLDPSRVTFYTLPTVADGQGLQMTAQGPRIWNALVNDQPLPGERTAKPTTTAVSSPSPSHSTAPATPTPVTRTITRMVTSTPTAPQLISVAPDSIDLQVVNVSGRGGVATAAMNALNPLGFSITDPDLLLIPGDVRSGVTVEYSDPNRAAALTVAAAVPGATLVRTDGLGSTVRLMLGSSFDGTVRAVTVGGQIPAALSTTASPVISTVVSTTTVTPPVPEQGATSTTSPSSATTSPPPTSLSGVSSVNAAQADCF